MNKFRDDDFRKYEEMKNAGIQAKEICKLSKDAGLGLMAQIRMLRSLFGLSLIDAKEIAIICDGTSASLNEHQEKLIPSLKKALDLIDEKDS